jgi:hypothetical protein
VKVTDRHTAIDYAHMLRDLSDVHFPDAAKIVPKKFVRKSSRDHIHRGKGRLTRNVDNASLLSLGRL